MLEAAKNGRINEVKELLDIGVNIEAKDDDGLYSFHNHSTTYNNYLHSNKIKNDNIHNEH